MKTVQGRVVRQWRSWVEVDAWAHLNVGGASVGG